MKKFISVLLAMVMVLSLGSVAFAEEAPAETPEYSLSVGTVLVETTCIGQTLLKIDEALRERSDGRLGLEIFWSSTAGGTVELCESVSMGTLDIAILNSAVLSNYVSNIDVMNYAYVFRDREHVKKAVELYFDEITEGISDVLGEPLGLWELGWRELMNTKHTVSCLEDFKGLTIRIQEGKSYYDTFNALGCIPTEVAVAELVTALQQGVVDAHENPLATMVNQHHYEFAKYLTMTNHIFGNSLPVLSETTKASLPEDLLQILYEVFDEYKFYSMDIGQQLEEDFLNTLIENDVEVTYLEDDKLQEIVDVCKTVWPNFSNQELLEKIVAIDETAE